MSKTLLFLITFFSLQIVIFAERLPVRIFTSADGLGSSFVDTMMRDSRGFLWFCTRDGLSRFDGTQFITYQVGAENTSPGVENISETSNGTYWIVTTGGLYRFKNDVLSNPESAGSNRPILKAEFISPLRGKVYEDKSRQLWLINNKAFRIKETSEGKVDFTEESLNLPKISDQPFNIFKLRETDDGSLWIGTNIGFLRRLPDGRAVFYRFNRSLRDSVVNLLVAKDGNIWISLLEQLVIINPASIEEMKNFGALTVVNLETVPTKRLDDAVLVLPQKPNEIFNYSSDAFLNLFSGIDIFQTSNGSIWLTTGKELMVYNGKRVTRFGSSKGLVDSRKMLEDSEGNLWIGGSNGLMRLDLDGLFTYDMDDGLKSLYTRTIQQGSDGKIYTSQGDYSLGQFDGEKFHTISLNLPADSKALWASRNAWQDKKGEWWILSENGLYHFPAISDFQQLENRTPIAVYDKKRGLKGDRVFQIFEDSHSDIWIATDSEKEEEKGLSLWSRQTQEITTISDKNGYPRDKQVASFAEDTDGSLWIGFYEGGVARFRDGHFTEFGESFGVPSGMISDLLIDPNGRLWIASTRGGLLRVNNPKDETPQFSVITIANGLASNNIRTLIQDLNGNLYLGTVRGVDRLSPETGQIQHFSIADGLATDFVVDSICDKDGTIWFATLNGLSKLVPKTTEKKTAPQTWINKLKIAGETKPLSEFGSKSVENLDLSANENNLQIEFFGLNFDPAGTLRYQFLLEGADQDWSPPNEQQSVSYANLQPGTYRFLVRAVNNVGVVSENPAVISFKINPPFYRTWWFITLSFLMLAGSVFALDRYRVRKTRQIENALAQSKESEIRFRTLADTASDGILTIDTDSNIIFVNQAIEKVFGYSAEELIGNKMTMLMPERMRGGHDAGINRYLSTNKKNINWEGVTLPGLHKDGHEIPLEVSFGEFEREGKRYFTGIARDISERKRAEKALQEAREEKFRELERVRTRIATDLHDDIGSSLTQIAVLSEVARGQAHHLQAENLSTPLERIKGVSKELVSVMSDIVWAINPNKDFLHDLIQRMRRFASDVLTGRGIKFEFQTPEIEDDMQLGANIRREFFAIFKESVNNIVKYSEATEVKVYFQIKDDWLILKIEDNGQGFDTDEILSEDFRPEMGGNGLVNMRRRAKDLGGNCEIHSEINHGTKIMLKIPLHLQENVLAN